jgi:hypothetical protein
MLQNVTPTAAIAAVASATTRACRFPTEADMDRLPKPAKSVESDPTETSAGHPSGRCLSHYRVLV